MQEAFKGVFNLKDLAVDGSQFNAGNLDIIARSTGDMYAGAGSGEGADAAGGGSDASNQVTHLVCSHLLDSDPVTIAGDLNAIARLSPRGRLEETPRNNWQQIRGAEQ